MSDKDINDITSSPQRESVTISSQSSFTEPWIPLSKADKDELELMSNMAAVAGITDIDAYKSGLNPADLNEGEERCGLCQCPLTKEFVDTWRDKIGSEIIRLGQWTEIHEAHIKKAQEEEWKAKGYPENIEWEELAGRAKKHMRWLKDIISDKVESRYRRMFKQQLKDTKGNAAMLLRQEHKLPFPGYYGPRGADIM